jgi:hypothetical protein
VCVGGGVVEAGSPGRAPMGAHYSFGQGAPGRALTRDRCSSGQGVVNSRREGPSPSLTKQSAFDWDPGSPPDGHVPVASCFSSDPMLLEVAFLQSLLDKACKP